jgi:nitrogen regulatory protein PII 2
MKEIMAIVRMNKINQTKTALVGAGYPSFTAMKVSGRGKRSVDFEVLQAINEQSTLNSEVLATLSQGPRLIPKRLISLVVPDEKVSDVVDLITKVNQTGMPGDGKIFVVPIEDVVRVRTKETGPAAIDEMSGKNGG